MERARKTCLDLISQKKTYSTDFNMLKKPANENYQMLSYHEDEYKPKEIKIDFQSARVVLMKEDYKTIVKRRFERIHNMMECKLYMKNEDIPENKEIFDYGFKHIKTDKIDIYILFGCHSDEIFENEKLFNFWTIKFIIREMELRVFKITGWPFMTFGKRNKFFKIQSIVCS